MSGLARRDRCRDSYWSVGRPFAVVIVLCVCLAGCGSSMHTAHLGSLEKIANACGNVRARLEGIDHEVGFRDLTLALFRGNTIDHRLRLATKQALSTLAERTRELESVGAPRAALRAISTGERSYEVFARQLVGDRTRDFRANLRLGVQFEGIGLRTAVTCEKAA